MQHYAMSNSKLLLSTRTIIHIETSFSINLVVQLEKKGRGELKCQTDINQQYYVSKLFNNLNSVFFSS
jgi:hypothetical protein